MINKTLKEAIYEINTGNDTIESYKTFFSAFNVELQNPDGTFKSVYEIFQEASENYSKSNINLYL